MKKILFVCGNPPHPVHKKFAESIGADFYYFNDSNSWKKIKSIFKISKDYDIYFSEGLFSYIVIAKILKIISKKSKLINLFADPRIYQIVDGKKFNFEKGKIKKYSKLKKLLVSYFVRNLDGGLCVGKFEEKILNKISKIPSKNCPAFIDRKDFLKFKSKINQNNILFIGGGPDYYYKGVDFLIEVFSIVQKGYPNSKLFIVGGKWENFKKEFSNENILFLGKRNLKELQKIMNKCSLCCHFGRGDTFPVATLEAMASGIPCIVSETTGTKEIVEKISKKFTISMEDKKKVFEVIDKYFRKSKKEKQKLANKFQNQAKFYNEKNCINIFKEEFSDLIKEIRKNESINDKSSDKNCR